MSLEPRFSIRRRWVVRFAVAVVVIAVVVGLALWFTGRRDNPQDDPTTPTPTSTSDDTGSRVANGCLGGQAVNAQTVLTAQQQAPLDDVGAAELTATFLRWSGLDGETLPPLDEIETVIDAIAAPDAGPALTEGYNESVEAGAAETERTGPPVSTVEGGYYIESSDEGGVVLSILVIVPEYPREGGGTESRAFSGTWQLVRSDVWRIQDFEGGTRSPEDLASIMTPFVGGC